MADFFAPFAAATVLIGLIQLNTGFIADRSWGAVVTQPFIAGAWCVGISGVVRGPLGVAGYIAGSTAGALLVACWRNRRHPCPTHTNPAR